MLIKDNVVLFNCIKCGKEVNITADVCPNCGTHDFLPANANGGANNQNYVSAFDVGLRQAIKGSSNGFSGGWIFPLIVLAFIIWSDACHHPRQQTKTTISNSATGGPVESIPEHQREPK